MCYLDFNPQRTAVIQFDFLRSENIINVEGYHVAENALRDDRDTFLHTHDFFEIFVMLVNYSGEPRPIEATLKTGYRIARVDYGNAETLAPYDAAVLYLERL